MSRSTKNSRLVRVLLVRAMGVMALYALYQTATYALSPSAGAMVSFGLGMISLVLLFMGVFMTFGKIEKEGVVSDKEEITADSVAQAFSRGFDEGYEKAMEDVEDQKIHVSSGDAGLPSTADRAPDE